MRLLDNEFCNVLYGRRLSNSKTHSVQEEMVCAGDFSTGKAICQVSGAVSLLPCPPPRSPGSRLRSTPAPPPRACVSPVPCPSLSPTRAPAGPPTASAVQVCVRAELVRPTHRRPQHLGSDSELSPRRASSLCSVCACSALRLVLRGRGSAPLGRVRSVRRGFC